MTSNVYRVYGEDSSTENTIIATQDFVEAVYPDRWELVGPYEEPAEPAPVLPPIGERIDAERDRRIQHGFSFQGVFYQSRLEDQKRISGAATLALGAMVAGKEVGDYHWTGDEEPFAWIAADNTVVPMDAHTVFMFGQAAANWESKHVFAARTLKNMEPPPDDFTDDQYWPS